MIFIMRSVVNKLFRMQPVKVRSGKLAECLGSYLRDICGDAAVDAPETLSGATMARPHYERPDRPFNQTPSCSALRAGANR
jgi:hypothetical protein